LRTDNVPDAHIPQLDLDSAGSAARGSIPRSLTPQITTFAPPAGTQGSRGMAPDWLNPSAHEGDVTVERELPGGISVSAAYVVSRGLHLPIFVDANLAPATTTKSYDILNLSSAVTRTYTVPFIH
jgi:hypothetical protein